MKKSSLVIIIISCTCFLLSSCSKLANVTITKRLYRSGYYVDFGSNKQHMTKPKASAPITSEAMISEAMTSEEMISAATPSAPDKLEGKSGVCPEKITPELSPVFISGNTQEKKQAHKKANSKLYASTQDLTTIKKEMQRVLIKNKIASNENIINSTTSSSGEPTPQWLLIVFSIILPPLAIALKFGIATKFWISVLLTILFWIPGVIYALYWILQK